VCNYVGVSIYMYVCECVCMRVLSVSVGVFSMWVHYVSMCVRKCVRMCM